MEIFACTYASVQLLKEKCLCMKKKKLIIIISLFFFNNNNYYYYQADAMGVLSI